LGIGITPTNTAHVGSATLTSGLRPPPQSPDSGPPSPIYGTGDSVHIGNRTTMSMSQTVLREKLEHALGVQARRLAVLRHSDPGGESAQDVGEAFHLLGMLLEGLDEGQVREIPEHTVGFGSLVTVRDLDTGRDTAHRIMSGQALDLDAGHISLDSALGSALVGMSVGAEVDACTPVGRRRVCILGLQTVHQFLDETLHAPDPDPMEYESSRVDLERVSS